ncbi:ABC transporter ATP-binding protein [Metallumcola ferriviriculae]|uniref:ABC transporter ATP-binding protein n=1 Tax=Metallumcola ferriviriculae TaxID=3039180 RepID=A0AAU0UMF6_9FIRM|nr:ABC transporter ATP-binding protein [Desulfitibacteraceae bacterium MK1]
MDPGQLLKIDDLKVSFFTHAGEVKAVRGVNLHLNKGDTLGIVGESGCGKSVTAQSIMKLIPSPPGRIVCGSINFAGVEIATKTERAMQKIRGNDISMIFQDPMTSLNPTMGIGRQIVEGLQLHQKMNADKARKRTLELLGLVGIPNPEKCITQYPYQLSGGMRQRVMIAIALACEPKLLIADEPTTALDVTIQAQILDLMKDLQKKLDTAIVLITHDLGVVAEVCDRVLVMYAGKVVEEGNIRDIFYHSQHPYSWGLLKSVPRMDNEAKSNLVPINGQPPDLISPPKGCAFSPRCEKAMQVCQQHQPEMFNIRDGHSAACWLLDPRAKGVVS